jgi:hypothetical protein
MTSLPQVKLAQPACAFQQERGSLLMAVGISNDQENLIKIKA